MSRNISSAVCLFLVLLFTGCGAGSAPGSRTDGLPSSPESKSRPSEQSGAAPAPASSDKPVPGGGAPRQQAAAEGTSTGTTDVTLKQAGDSQASTEAVTRKIIRNAELTLEVSDPAPLQQEITSIAESNNGFVVTSESRQTTGAKLAVTVTIRVPAERFASVVEALRGSGGKILREKVTGLDVTEEYIDLEAHVRTKQALEAQFLEIMKQAKTVPDALNVQRELANVRTEIERLQGRLRFLANQSALSTITVTLQTPTPAVASSGDGFGETLGRAWDDAVNTAKAIVLGFIRFLGVALPVLLLVGVPVWFVLWLIYRRMRNAWRRSRERQAAAVPPPAAPPVVE